MNIRPDWKYKLKNPDLQTSHSENNLYHVLLITPIHGINERAA